MSLKKITFSCMLALVFHIPTTLEAALAGANPSGVAAPTDAYAGVVNPAGIMYVGDRYDAGFRWLHDKKHFRFKGNTTHGANQSLDASYRQENEFFADVAVNKTFKTKHCCRTWEWALNFVSYTELFSRVSTKVPVVLAGTSPLDFTVFKRVVSVMGALKLNDEHSIGVSIDFCKFRFRVYGSELFDNPLLTVSPGNVTNNGYANTFGLGTTLGWRWQVTKQFAMGATFSPEINFNKIHKYSGFHPDHGLIQSPNAFKIGFLYVFNPKIAVVFDIEWDNYARTKTPGNRLLNALGQFNTLGAKYGASAGWKNRFITSLAVVYNYSEKLALRGYYIHYTQKVPRSQTYYNIVLCSLFTDIFACGATYKFWEKNDISVFYAHALGKKLKGAHSVPLTLGGGNANLKEDLDILSVSLGHNY